MKVANSAVVLVEMMVETSAVERDHQSVVRWAVMMASRWVAWSADALAETKVEL